MDNGIPTMTDADLMRAWNDVSDQIAREDEARSRGEGYWCGTPYISDCNRRARLAAEFLRRGLSCPLLPPVDDCRAVLASVKVDPEAPKVEQFSARIRALRDRWPDMDEMVACFVAQYSDPTT